MRKELKLMEMVVVLYINKIISWKDRNRFLELLQNRLDLEMEKERDLGERSNK